MMDITMQISRFFVNNNNVSERGDFVPHTSEGNTVTPLVDGDNYFHALRIEVDTLKAPGGTGKFFYFANWWLALAGYAGGTPTMGSGLTSWTGLLNPISPFKLDDELGGPYPDFIDELATMSANGTDVRALVWISPLIVQFEEAAGRSGLYHVNASSLLSIDALRQKPGMGKSACLNILGHPLGAMHLKMVVCGDGTGGRAYVSGIDLVNNRIDGQMHPDGSTFGWHDAGTKVEGEAVQGVYNYFQQLWKEVLARSTETFRIGDTKVKSKVDGTLQVPNRTFSSPASGGMHVQVLRTAPAMNFAIGETARAPISCFKRLVSGFRRDKWSPAAQDGIFEFKLSLKKAISNAQRYIYVEDQGFVGQPIMDWLREALASNPNLKLIMVHHADPADGPEVLKQTSTAINNHLCSSSMNMDAQIAFYERQDQVVVHSKTWIVDDQFIIVGSTNCYRRALYTDGEISVAVLDEDATTNHVAIRYRNMLWAEHCGKYSDPERAAFNDLARAIKIWDTTWGIDGAPPVFGPPPGALLTVYQRKKVPFEAGSDPDQFPSVDTSLTPIQYDQVDADSRLEY
jgi:phosphatidylserine/phosphatidylglycerophosphate/cardiolipin synthase-like enzyme